MAKITKELENPKVLQQILQQSVADVESKHINLQVGKLLTNDVKQRLSKQKHNRYPEESGGGWDETHIRFLLSPVLSIKPVP